MHMYMHNCVHIIMYLAMYHSLQIHNAINTWDQYEGSNLRRQNSLTRFGIFWNLGVTPRLQV